MNTEVNTSTFTSVSASADNHKNMEGNTMNTSVLASADNHKNMEGNTMNTSVSASANTTENMEGKTMMKRASYNEKTAKAVFDAIKQGASLDVIAETFNVRTLSTIKGWLDRYYTKKKAVAGAIYAQLLENNRAAKLVKSLEVPESVEVIPQILVTQPVEVDTCVVSTIAEAVEEPRITLENRVCEYPDVLVELENALKANGDMNTQLDEKGEKAMLLVDIGSLLFETAETPESAIRTLINILASLAAVSTKNVFCWHREIMSWKYKTDSELLEKAADLALSYGWFFARNHRINAREYRVISNRAYATFMEVLNPHDVAAISTEDALFSEFNHSEKFSVYKKKNCWTGSERTIRTEFCKAVGLKEADGQLTISPQPVKGYFCVKEGEMVEFTWETTSEIEIWKYEFHEGSFYDVGHRKGGKQAKSLLVKTA